MKHEFKVTRSKDQTIYTLESATGGSSSSGDFATADTTLGGMQRRNPPGDNILAQEKKETPKPRNFVAKNAKMGGAGQHKDKKKAEKQGDVKHKKPLAESYAEDLAKQVFDANPNIKDENAVLDAAWPIVVQDLGKKTAMSMFNYDEDFPSDLVSVYGWLQKGTSEGVSDLSYDAQSLITKLRRDVEEKRLQPTPQAVLAAARELAGDMEFAPQLLVKQVLGQGVAEGSEEGNLYATALQKYPQLKRVDREIVINALNNAYEDYLMHYGYEGIGPDEESSMIDHAVKGLKQGVAEDHEIQMASSELQSIAKNAVHLLDLVRKYSEQEGLEAWQQSKITKSADYLNSVLQSISGKQSGMEETRNNYHANTTGFRRGQRDPEGENPQVGQQVWGLKINGKVWSKDGKDVTFTSKEAALNTRNAILKNRPDLEIGLVTKGGVSEGERTMSRAAKGHEKYGKYNEEWSQKYKSSINCSHPKGFSQKAHCAGKKKHDESIETESVCPDCGMCEAHGNNKIYDKCWTGFRKVPGKARGEKGSCKEIGEDDYMESLTNMLERSVSQAQHNLMVGVAHNPQFAQKVKVKQKVGQEFARADQGHDISKLPIRVPKKK